MKNSLFRRVMGNEDYEGGDVETEVTGAEVSEISEEDLEYAENVEEVTGEAEDVLSVEEAATDLEEATEETDEIIEEAEEAGEEVADEEVVAATESYRFAIRKLSTKATLKDAGIPNPSYEMRGNNNLKLRMSNEAAKNFLGRLIEKVKKMFTALVNQVKKFYAKLVIYMGRIEKRAQAFVDSLKKRSESVKDDEAGKLQDNDKKTITKHMGFSLIDGNTGADNYKAVMNILHGGTPCVEGFVKKLKNAETQLSAYMKMKNTDNGFDAAEKAYYNAIETAYDDSDNKIDTVATKFTDEVTSKIDKFDVSETEKKSYKNLEKGTYKNYVTYKNNTTKATEEFKYGVLIPINITGKSVSFIKILPSTRTETEKTTQDAEAAKSNTTQYAPILTVSKATLRLKEKNLYNDKLTLLKKTEIEAVAGEILKHAKAMKKTANTYNGYVIDLESTIKTIEKANNDTIDSKCTKAVSNYMSACRSTAAIVGTEAVIGLVSSLNSVLSSMILMANKYKMNES